MAIKAKKMSNKRYQDERDKLIPFAEMYANDACGNKELPRYARDLEWSKYFHKKMDSLAREHGLIC